MAVKINYKIIYAHVTHTHTHAHAPTHVPTHAPAYGILEIPKMFMSEELHKKFSQKLT